MEWRDIELDAGAYVEAVNENNNRKLAEVLQPGLETVKAWAGNLKRKKGAFGVKSNGVMPPIKTGEPSRCRGAFIKLQCDKQGEHKSTATERNRQASKRCGCTWRLCLEVCRTEDGRSGTCTRRLPRVQRSASSTRPISSSSSRSGRTRACVTPTILTARASSSAPSGRRRTLAASARGSPTTTPSTPTGLATSLASTAPLTRTANHESWHAP